MAEGVANDAQSVAAPLVVSCSPKQAGEGDNAVEVLCERRDSGSENAKLRRERSSDDCVRLPSSPRPEVGNSGSVVTSRGALRGGGVRAKTSSQVEGDDGLLLVRDRWMVRDSGDSRAARALDGVIVLQGLDAFSACCIRRGEKRAAQVALPAASTGITWSTSKSTSRYIQTGSAPLPSSPLPSPLRSLRT